MFKPGDSVVCVDTDDAPELSLNQVYTVDVTDITYNRVVRVKGIPMTFYAARFRKVESPNDTNKRRLEVGDYVVCKRTFGTHLYENHIYRIDNLSESANSVSFDPFPDSWYSCNYFERTPSSDLERALQLLEDYDEMTPKRWNEEREKTLKRCGRITRGK